MIRHVESIADWRKTDDALLELRVRRLGLTPADTWEPIDQLHENQPALVKRFLRRVQRECELAPVLLESYGSAQAGQDPVERRATVAAAAAAATAATTAAATGAGQRGKRGCGRSVSRSGDADAPPWGRCSGDRSVPCVVRRLIRSPDYLWVLDSSSMLYMHNK